MPAEGLVLPASPISLQEAAGGSKHVICQIDSKVAGAWHGRRQTGVSDRGEYTYVPAQSVVVMLVSQLIPVDNPLSLLVVCSCQHNSTEAFPIPVIKQIPTHVLMLPPCAPPWTPPAALMGCEPRPEPVSVAAGGTGSNMGNMRERFNEKSCKGNALE
jgi:hypothetical protein